MIIYIYNDKIFIGGSCIGYGSTKLETTVNEIRFVRDDRHDPIAWNTVDMSIDNNIKMLLTVDSYLVGNRGWGSDETLANFTQECINKYKSKTSRKSTWFLDNEADEIYSIESYLHYLDIFQRIVRRNGFEVGAGNFQFRKDYIMGLVFHKDLYDVVGIHMQNGFETASKIETNGNWYKQLKNTYKLRMTCTEAIPTGWNLNEHYPLVIKQLLKAIDIGCEDFCVIFIHGEKPEMLENYRQLTFTLHPAIWTDFKRIIKDNKPTIKKEEDMILDNLYYKDRPEEKYVRDPEKRGIKFLRACFKLSDSNLFDAALDSEIRLYQASKGFVVDGKVGPETFGGLILEADYQKYYNWVQHDWATYS